MTNVLAVVRIFRLSPQRIALVPWAVKSGGTTKFTGRPCDRTVVVTSSDWRARGLEIVRAVMSLAPLRFDDPLHDWGTRRTDDVFDMGTLAARALGFVSRAPGRAPVLSRVEVRPRERGYRSPEVFRVKQTCTQEQFLENLARLMGE